MQPLAMIALFDVFPPDRRGSAMGIFGFGIVLAPAIGPSVGGVLVQCVRLAFDLPAVGAFLHRRDGAGPALVCRGARGSRTAPRFDWIGIGAARRGAGGAAERAGRRASRRLDVGRARRSRRRHLRCWSLASSSGNSGRAAPLLALRLFASRSFRSAALVAFAYGLGLFGTTYLIPVFVQDVATTRRRAPARCSCCPGVALASTIVVAGRLTDRMEPRRIVAAGLACFAVSSALLAFADETTLRRCSCLWLVVGRVGLGMIIPALNVGAVQALDAKYIAYAAASVNFVRQLGGAIGVNLLAVLLEWRLGERHRTRRRGDGLPGMLLGGYDRICGGDAARAVDPKACSSLTARLGGTPCIARSSIAYNGTPESRSALDEAIRLAPDAVGRSTSRRRRALSVGLSARR